MAKVLDLPKLSPTMEEGQIAKWHKKEGDVIGVDDLLAEVETDKATMEYRSFDKGVLLRILAPAGAVVQLGQPVAIVGSAGEDISALVPGASRAVQAAPPASAVAPIPAVGSGSPSAPPATTERSNGPNGVPDRMGQEGSTSEGLKTSPSASVGADGRIKASPYVRKLAREHGYDLSRIGGTGPGGRIVARDLASASPASPVIAAHAPAPAPSAAAPPAKPAPFAPQVAAVGAAEPEVRPLSMMRKTIARRLTESKQTVPHFYLTIDVDADALWALREQINLDLAAGYADPKEAPKVSVNDLLVRASAIALREVPECNAQFTPDAILVHKRVDISVAVAVADGLVTPVVRSADQKGVLAIAAEVRDLAARAKAKKLKPEEMANGTFSISNLGMFGIDAFAAVINPPEGAILAVGQVRREPVVKGDAVVPGRKLAMTLSCDHRVVDGAVGATFLKALRRILEHPTRILVA